MHRPAILLLSVVFTHVLLACSESNDTASTKFIPFGGLGKAYPYLVHDVKEPSWLIHYGFSDNDLCRSSGVADPEKFEQQLRDSTLKAIKIWLQPLRELDTDIVDDFTLTRVDTEKSTYGNKTSTRLVRGKARPHLSVVFHCKVKGQTEYPYSTGGYGKVDMRHIYNQAKLFPRNKMSDEHMFMMTTMLHELGHAFGLADTYAGASPEQQNLGASLGNEGSRRRHDTSDSEHTLGKQPLAIMGVANLLGVDPEPFITADDAEGIRWLYRLAQGNISADECPENYVIEPETKGCLPRYPLMFAIRNADVRRAQAMLQDSSIDINACDQYGRNALFYAQQHERRHGGNLPKLLKDKGAQLNCPTSELIVNDLSASAGEVESADARAAMESSCGIVRHNPSSDNTLLLCLMLFAVLTKIFVNPKTS